jgi:retron-type reverse transcriptase
MRRRGYISPKIETNKNFSTAYDNASGNKQKRPDVVKFGSNLEENLKSLLLSYTAGTWKTSDYEFFHISDPKPRLISKLPFEDHVIQWAALNLTESYLVTTFINDTYSCIKGRGTHGLMKTMKRDLYYSRPSDTRYYSKMDVHHFYANINHAILKDQYRRKIKDPKLLSFLDEVVDSFQQGLPLGIKLSQLLANLNLSSFDHDAKNCFHIMDDPDRMAYWTSRYITDKIATAHSIEDQMLLDKGSLYLAGLFKRFVSEGLRYYYRYADDIVMLHSDKTFLHIMTELAIMHISRDLLLQIKPNWKISPIEPDGLDYVGYVFFHDHTMVRKRNKQALCRQVSELRKKGLTNEEIRLKAASRVGFVSHADTKNLLTTLGMEQRLGKLIKKRKKKAPFEGLDPELDKQSIETILFDESAPGANENDRLIHLIDFKVEDSVVEKNDDGTPKKRIAIRYNMIDHVDDGPEPEYHWQEKEWYSFSGSKIMIEQAESDFSRDDLPIPTVVKLMYNDKKKKFYKFT